MMNVRPIITPHVESHQPQAGDNIALSRRKLLQRFAGTMAVLGTNIKLLAINNPPATQPDRKPCIPRIVSPWTTIVNDPRHHLNDFCLFKDHQQTWHCMGIMGTGTWGSEQSLFHATGKDLHKPFMMQPPLLTETPPKGTAPQKHAPFVVRFRDLYHLFYRRPQGTILHLTSPDPNKWVGLGEIVFRESDARDICILSIDNVFHMYYCQLITLEKTGRSAILLRKSTDLKQWSAPVVVHVDESEPAEHSYLESPFAVARPEGFYLFVRHRRLPQSGATIVLFSNRPDAFPSGQQKWLALLDHTHAMEIVTDQGRYYAARVSGAPHADSQAPAKSGHVDIAELRFEPVENR